MLFVNLVMQLLKGSCYERFVRPVCGMILVILIVSPVLRLFGADEKLLLSMEQKISFLLAQKDREITFAEEAGYEFAVLEAYEEELVMQLAKLLEQEGISIVSADFSISAEKEDFGTIRGITLYAGKEKGTEEEKIRIAPILLGKEKREATVSAEEIRIKDKLADFYNVDADNIYVSIKEEQDG